LDRGRDANAFAAPAAQPSAEGMVGVTVRDNCIAMTHPLAASRRQARDRR